MMTMTTEKELVTRSSDCGFPGPNLRLINAAERLAWSAPVRREISREYKLCPVCGCLRRKATQWYDLRNVMCSCCVDERRKKQQEQ